MHIAKGNTVPLLNAWVWSAFGNILIVACCHSMTFLNVKDFSNILIFCEGPSPPHQLILPLHPPGQAVLLKGDFCKMHQGFFHLNLSSGESPLFLAWPTTRVVSVTLPSDSSTSSSIILPRQIKKGKQRKGNLKKRANKERAHKKSQMKKENIKEEKKKKANKRKGQIKKE